MNLPFTKPPTMQTKYFFFLKKTKTPHALLQVYHKQSQMTSKKPSTNRPKTINLNKLLRICLRNLAKIKNDLLEALDRKATNKKQKSPPKCWPQQTPTAPLRASPAVSASDSPRPPGAAHAPPRAAPDAAPGAAAAEAAEAARAPGASSPPTKLGAPGERRSAVAVCGAFWGRAWAFGVIINVGFGFG